MPNEPSLRSPAPEILDYLGRHPNAQDTIEGIMHWWVLESSIRHWGPIIGETVNQLVEEGFLEQKQSTDGRIYYCASAAYRRTLQRPTSPNS